MSNGVLIIDNSALKYLGSTEARSRFRGNLRAAGWRAWPSAVNLLEALKDKNPDRRSRLLDTIAWLADGRGLLPWPHEVLQEVGRQILTGRNQFRLDWSGLEGLLQREITNADSDAAADFLNSQQEVFEELHRSARTRIQRWLKESTLKSSEYDLPQFLDDIWLEPGYYHEHLSHLWTHFELPGEAPLSGLSEATSWRLFVESYGAVAYHQAFKKEQGKKVQLPDILQLVYLSAGNKRAIVTEDKAFRELASRMLHPRHPRSYALPVAAFIE